MPCIRPIRPGAVVNCRVVILDSCVSIVVLVISIHIHQFVHFVHYLNASGLSECVFSLVTSEIGQIGLVYFQRLLLVQQPILPKYSNFY